MCSISVEVRDEMQSLLFISSYKQYVYTYVIISVFAMYLPALPHTNSLWWKLILSNGNCFDASTKSKHSGHLTSYWSLLLFRMHVPDISMCLHIGCRNLWLYEHLQKLHWCYSFEKSILRILFYNYNIINSVEVYWTFSYFTKWMKDKWLFFSSGHKMALSIHTSICPQCLCLTT